MFATNDPITGVDQKSMRFWRTVADKFAALTPRNEYSRGRYVARLGTNDKGECVCDTKSIKKHFEVVSRDVQKFEVSLRLVYNSDPTGSVMHTHVNDLLFIRGARVRWSTASCKKVREISGPRIVYSYCKARPNLPSRVRPEGEHRQLMSSQMGVTHAVKVQAVHLALTQEGKAARVVKAVGAGAAVTRLARLARELSGVLLMGGEVQRVL